MVEVKEFKKSEDNDYISLIIRKLSKEKEVPVTVHYQGTITKAILYFSDRKGNALFIKNDNENVLFSIHDAFEISLISKDDFFVFGTKILSNTEQENFYKIERPVVTYSSLRRLVTRCVISEHEEAYITFGEQKSVCRIIDISTKGLSFFSENSFCNGQIVRNILVQLPTGNVWVDGIIRVYRRPNQDQAYGMVFANSDWEFFLHVFSYIFKRKYPDLESIMNFSYDEIYTLFEDSGYLDLKPRTEMDSNFSKVFSNFSKLNNLPQITGGYVYCDEGKPLSTGSVLRIYNQTFLGHQLAASVSARHNLKSKSDIYQGITEFLLNNPYFNYYLTYFNANSLWHREMYKKICELVNNSEQMIMDTIEYFECIINEIANETNESSYGCFVLDDPAEFIAFAHENMKPLVCRCYAYSDKDEFLLTRIKSIYETLGLFLNRRLWRIEMNHKTIAYAVAEVYSDGLNLYNLLDMCRLYFVKTTFHLPSLLKVLLPHVAFYFHRHQKDKFNLLVNTDLFDIDASCLNIQGVCYSHLFGRVLSNREGGLEYIRLIKN